MFKAMEVHRRRKLCVKGTEFGKGTNGLKCSAFSVFSLAWILIGTPVLLVRCTETLPLRDLFIYDVHFRGSSRNSTSMHFVD